MTMATPRNPYTNPLDVYNALYEARAKGPVNDPYNLNAAVLRAGAGYGLLADQVRSAAVAEGLSNTETARQQAGYYPAQAGYSTAIANTGIEEQQQKLAAIQDIEAAWQAARAALPNEEPGSDLWNQTMLSHMTTRAGAAKITPDVIAGHQREQTRNLQTQAAKEYIDNQIRNNFIKKYMAENKGLMLQIAEENGLTPQNANEMLVAAAQNLADKKVQELNVQADIDPRGEITLYDPQGRQVPLNFEAKAAIQRMASEFSSPYAIGKEMRAAADARQKQDWLLAPPVGPGTTKKEPPPKPIPLRDNPTYSTALAIFNSAAQARRALKPDDDPDYRKKVLSEYDEAKNMLLAASKQTQPASGGADALKNLYGATPAAGPAAAPTSAPQPQVSSEEAIEPDLYGNVANFGEEPPPAPQRQLGASPTQFWTIPWMR